MPWLNPYKEHPMIINDRRTAEQKDTHTWFVTAKDRFMSGWGIAKGGASYCAWACESRQQAEACLARIRGRCDMRYIRMRFGIAKWRPRAAHLSIYVSTDKVAP